MSGMVNEKALCCFGGAGRLTGGTFRSWPASQQPGWFYKTHNKLIFITQLFGMVDTHLLLVFSWFIAAL